MRDKTKKQRSEPEILLSRHIADEGLPEPLIEFYFAQPRKFRADFAWPKLKLLVEIEGGTWAHGRHTRGAGYQEDCYKYNLAAMLGYTVLRYTTAMVYNNVAIDDIKQFINRRNKS